tara:strand:+ start:2206 stop:2547 length:342 start_codon:yes stop_codon:yes gene_type:complete
MIIKVPTIKLVHKTTGARKIMNVMDYDPKTMPEWSKATGSVPATPQKAKPVPTPTPEKIKPPSQFDVKPIEVEVDTKWRDMPWPKRRGYIRSLTGQFPKSIEESEKIMAEFVG